MFMSMKVSDRFPNGFVLVSGGADVGWMRAGIIGFCGFNDRVEAQRAGQVAAETLADWYSLRWRSTPIAWADEVPLDHAISTGGVVVGSVCSRHPLSAPDTDSHGIELRIPHETWSALMLQLAQRMHAAMMSERLSADAARSASSRNGENAE